MGLAPGRRALSQVNPALGLRVVAVHVAVFCLPGASANRPRALQLADEPPTAGAAAAPAPARRGPEATLKRAAELEAGRVAEAADIHKQAKAARVKASSKRQIHAVSMTANGKFVRNSHRRARGAHPASFVAEKRAQVVPGAPLVPGGALTPAAQMLSSGDPAAYSDDGDGVFVPPPLPNGTDADLVVEEAEREQLVARRRAWARLRAIIANDTELEEGPPLTVAGRILMALAGGTGASIGTTGSLAMDKELARRMRVQDEVVIMLLLLVYGATLGLSALLAYRQAVNRSRVTYYADPRYHACVSEGHEQEAFLEAFNGPPKGVHLRVTGYTPCTELDGRHDVSWNDANYRVDFTFALDLSPWVVREHRERCETSGAPSETRRLEDGVVAEDLKQLREFLEKNKNDMAGVQMHKEISWSGWEELATNIKQRIRERGFTGIISIDRTESDSMSIYKNKQWANFMHSKTLKVILALSLVGWAAYLPYMYLRCSVLRVRSFFRVDISIDDYWPLISDNLSANGFEPPEDPALDPDWLRDEFGREESIAEILQHDRSVLSEHGFGVFEPVYSSDDAS